MLINTNRLVADPDQPRQYFNPQDMDILIRSIKEDGVRNDLHVEKQGDKFLVIDGERRFRAAHTLKLKELPCKVYEPMSDLERNILRFRLQETVASWSTMDRARAVALVWEQLKSQDEVKSGNELARILGMNASTVNAFLNLLNLNPKLQNKVENKEITVDWATKIAACTKNFTNRTLAHQVQARLFEMVEKKDIANRRELQNFSRAIRSENPECIKKLLSGKPYSDKQALADAGIDEAVEERELRSWARMLQTTIGRFRKAGLAKSLSRDTIDRLTETTKDIRQLIDNSGHTG